MKYSDYLLFFPFELSRFPYLDPKYGLCTSTNERPIDGTVHNDDGMLSCFGIKGEQGPAPVSLLLFWSKSTVTPVP